MTDLNYLAATGIVLMLAGVAAFGYAMSFYPKEQLPSYYTLILWQEANGQNGATVWAPGLVSRKEAESWPVVNNLKVSHVFHVQGKPISSDALKDAQ